jgi:hypothetical protein
MLSPTYVRVLGLDHGSATAADTQASRTAIMQALAASLPGRFDLPLRATRSSPAGEVFEGRCLEGVKIDLKLVYGADYSLFVVHSSVPDDDLSEYGSFAPLREAALAASPGENGPHVLFETELFACAGAPGDPICTEVLDGNVAAGSALRGRQVTLWLGEEGQEGRPRRYLMYAPTLALAERTIPPLLDSLARVELYQHKLHYLATGYADKYCHLRSIEDQLSERIDQIMREVGRSDPDRLEAWLHSMQSCLGDLSNVLSEESHDLHTVLVNADNIALQVRDWAEAAEPGAVQANHHSPLRVSELLLRDGEFGAQAYTRMVDSTEQMLARVQIALTILRTKVDLDRQRIYRQTLAQDRRRTLALALIGTVLAVGGFITSLDKFFPPSNDAAVRIATYVLFGIMVLVLLALVLHYRLTKPRKGA